MIHDVLIIGAGLSGLKAAGDLHAAGRSVLVLDKGRGVGGRAATRRWDGLRVDHGAQFFTARSDEFRAQVADWEARKVCYVWANFFYQWEDDGRPFHAPDPAMGSHPRYACGAGMSALGKDLARTLPETSIRLRSRVVKLKIADGHWQAELETGHEGGPLAGRSLILAMPAPQILALLKDSGLLEDVDPAVRSGLEAVEYAPTLAVMLRGNVSARPWHGIQLKDETLSWISDDSGKHTDPFAAPEDHHPQSGEHPRVFVLHASPGFSREWQDTDLEKAAGLMVARAGEIVGDWITQLPDRQIHRWRYANVPRGVPDAAFLRGGGNAKFGAPFYVCGDAFLGAKIEGAYCSGLETAKALLADPPRKGNPPATLRGSGG